MLPTLGARGSQRTGSAEGIKPSLHTASTTSLPSVLGALPKQDVADTQEAGAILRNLMGLSEAEQKEIEERERLAQEKEALIAAARAQELQRLQAQENASDVKATEDQARLSKKAALLEQIQEDATASSEKAKLVERSPDHVLLDGQSRYGYVSPPRYGYMSPGESPSAGAREREYGYISPNQSPRMDEALSGVENVASGDAFVRSTGDLPQQIAGLQSLGGKMITRLQAAARRVVKKTRTPGFLLLEQLAKQSGGRNLKTQERDLWRCIKKHYERLKKERQAANKASGKMALLRGDLKRRAALADKFKCAVQAVRAAREEQGPQFMKEFSNAIEAKKIFESSPELKAIKLLQRVFRRAQPLQHHPGIGPQRPLDCRLHTVWAAHVVLCRYGKARMSSDLMFLLGFSVGEQMGLLMGASKAAQSSPSSPAHAHPAARTSAWTSSARHLKHLYLQGGARVRESYRAALVLESAVERALNNRWWASVVWSGKEMGRWVGALQARREYWSNPALTPQIKSLFPWALATTNLANHAAALAQETLSAGDFTLGKSLLKVVEAELIMATSRAWKRRELAAMELVFRRLQLYSKRFHTPVAKLRSQITALIADIESRKAAGATSKHLAVTYNLVEELRAKMATLVAQGAGVQMMVRTLSRSRSMTFSRSNSTGSTLSLGSVDENDMGFMNNDFYDNTYTGESETESSDLEDVQEQDLDDFQEADEEHRHREDKEGNVGQDDGQMAIATDEEMHLMQLLEKQRLERRNRRDAGQQQQQQQQAPGLEAHAHKQHDAHAIHDQDADNAGLPRISSFGQLSRLPRNNSFGRLASITSVFSTTSTGSFASVHTKRRKLRLPPLILDWSVKHVLKWVKYVVCLPQYAEKFQNHRITGKKLVDLHELTLVSDLGITFEAHPRKFSNCVDMAIQSSLAFSEKQFRERFFEQFDRQHGRAQRKEQRRLMRQMTMRGNQMKKQLLTSPRMWTHTLDPSVLGSKVQPHFLVDTAGGFNVGTIELVKPEEQRAGHSFQEVGCLCEHNWVCPDCFVWNRGETSFDTLVCGWCGRDRPSDYHPPTWKSAGSLGEDAECPIKSAVQAKKEYARVLRVSVDEAPVDWSLPQPRKAYPRLTKHPPLVSQRGTADGRRLEEEWQAQQSGCHIIDEGETETDNFEDDDTDIVDRTGVPEMDLKATDHFEWNPVRRLLNAKGKIPGALERAQADKMPHDALAHTVITPDFLRRQRIGVVQSMLQ